MLKSILYLTCTVVCVLSQAAEDPAQRLGVQLGRPVQSLQEQPEGSPEARRLAIVQEREALSARLARLALEEREIEQKTMYDALQVQLGEVLTTEVQSRDELLRSEEGIRARLLGLWSNMAREIAENIKSKELLRISDERLRAHQSDYLRFAAEQGLLSPPAAPPAPVPDIVIPPEAVGHAEIYRRFFGGKLIYRPTEGRYEGKIELPIAGLANPLEGCFDLSRCGDAGQYVSVHTGYRRGKIAANANKVEVWLAPRFLVERDLENPPRNFGKILSDWDRAIPFGIYFTWGNWDNLELYDYEVRKTPEILNSENLYQIYEKAHFLTEQSRPTAYEVYSWLGSQFDYAKISILL